MWNIRGQGKDTQQSTMHEIDEPGNTHSTTLSLLEYSRDLKAASEEVAAMSHAVKGPSSQSRSKPVYRFSSKNRTASWSTNLYKQEEEVDDEQNNESGRLSLTCSTLRTGNCMVKLDCMYMDFHVQGLHVQGQHAVESLFMLSCCAEFKNCWRVCVCLVSGTSSHLTLSYMQARLTSVQV